MSLCENRRLRAERGYSVSVLPWLAALNFIITGASFRSGEPIASVSTSWPAERRTHAGPWELAAWRCLVSFSAMVESWEDRRRQVRGTAANELEGVYFNEVVIYSWLVLKAWCRMETSYVVPENLQKVPCLRWSPNPRVRFPGCFLTTLWHEVLGYIKTLCFL